MNNKDKIIKDCFKFLGKIFSKILIIFLVYILISIIFNFFQGTKYMCSSMGEPYHPDTEKEINIIKEFLKNEYPERKFKKIKLVETGDTRSCWGGGYRYSTYEVKDKNKRKYRFIFRFEKGLVAASYNDEYFKYKSSIDSNDVFLDLHMEKDFTNDDYEKMSMEATSFLKEKIDNNISIKAIITYNLYETDNLETEIFYDKNKSYEENIQINSEIIKNFYNDSYKKSER